MPRSTELERARRRHRLSRLLAEGAAGTQAELVRRLAREGFRVTQATVSRDLEELGAVRLRRGDRVVYALPEGNGPPAGLRTFAAFVLSVAASGNLVVVRTYPGMAPTVAAALDREAIPGALGTVAGDDTLLVVAAEGVSGRTLARRIREMGAP